MRRIETVVVVLVWLVHLAQDYEFRRLYGFPSEAVQAELNTALEAAAEDDAWWVRSFTASVRARLQQLP